MLSFIVRLVQEFEQEHGMRPNLLYMNDEHVKRLTDGFADQYDLRDITGMLGMEIVIDRQMAHPHVAWIQAMQRQRAN